MIRVEVVHVPMTMREIHEVLARYGRGDIDTDAAPAELSSEAELARRDRAERDPNDPDAASTPDLWSALGVARWTKVIKPEQYQQLGTALG